MRRFVFGTRGSDLALAQCAQAEQRLLSILKAVECKREIIRSTGDARLDLDLAAPGPLEKGLFTRELEEALLDRRIDFAVHSLKDLPTELPAGLDLLAVLPRAATEDVLLTRSEGGIPGLPASARVGTGSPRRAMQLLEQRPDLTLLPIRGNVPTRIRKLADGGYDAIVLARAGLDRLGLLVDGRVAVHAGSSLVATRLDFLPAPGQGAIALEGRSDDPATAAAARYLECHDSRIATAAERGVLQALGGGCAMALGTLAEVAADRITLQAVWQPTPGHPPIRTSLAGPVDAWEALASEVAAALRAGRETVDNS